MDSQDTTPTTPQRNGLRAAYLDLLIEVQDWRAKRTEENTRFYAEAIGAGRVRVIPGRERTTRRANCDVCLNSQPAGLLILFLTGPGSHRFHLCHSCETAVIGAVDMTKLLEIQVETR